MKGFLYNVAEVLVLTAGVAVCGAYITMRAPSLLDYEKVLVAVLYLVSPLCWLMPLTLRKTHLTLWLTLRLASWTEGPFTLWGEGLIMFVPGWILAAIFDAVIFLNGILAIRARSRNWRFLTSSHAVAIVVASIVGTAIALLVWSKQISREVAQQVQSLSQKAPYCLAVNARAIKSFDDASGLQLVRNTYFVGPGAGFSFPILPQFHAVLAVEDDKTVRYWYWSFRSGRFMPVKSPAGSMGGYACNPLTKEVVADSYLHPPPKVPRPNLIPPRRNTPQADSRPDR